MTARKHKHEEEEVEETPKKAAPKAKFAVGSKVVVDGVKGEIIEVPELDPEYVAKNEQFYSVRMETWDEVVEEYRDTMGEKKKKVFYKHPRTGQERDHQTDTLGCVPESQIKGA